MQSTQGRWTDQEHKSFLRALELYGKNWKKVQEYIGTRSAAQARSHAQKYFGRFFEKLHRGEITYSSPLLPSQKTFGSQLSFKGVLGSRKLTETDYEDPHVQVNEEHSTVHNPLLVKSKSFFSYSSQNVMDQKALQSLDFLNSNQITPLEEDNNSISEKSSSKSLLSSPGLSDNKQFLKNKSRFGPSEKEEFEQFEHIHREFSTYGQGILASQQLFVIERDNALYTKRQELYKRIRLTENSDKMKFNDSKIKKYTLSSQQALLKPLNNQHEFDNKGQSNIQKNCNLFEEQIRSGQCESPQKRYSSLKSTADIHDMDSVYMYKSTQSRISGQSVVDDQLTMLPNQSIYQKGVKSNNEQEILFNDRLTGSPASTYINFFKCQNSEKQMTMLDQTPPRAVNILSQNQEGMEKRNLFSTGSQLFPKEQQLEKHYQPHEQMINKRECNLFQSIYSQNTPKKSERSFIHQTKENIDLEIEKFITGPNNFADTYNAMPSSLSYETMMESPPRIRQQLRGAQGIKAMESLGFSPLQPLRTAIYQNNQCQANLFDDKTPTPLQHLSAANESFSQHYQQHVMAKENINKFPFIFDTPKNHQTINQEQGQWPYLQSTSIASTPRRGAMDASPFARRGISPAMSRSPIKRQQYSTSQQHHFGWNHPSAK